jgi:hypothetical protein
MADFFRRLVSGKDQRVTGGIWACSRSMPWGWALVGVYGWDGKSQEQHRLFREDGQGLAVANVVVFGKLVTGSVKDRSRRWMVISPEIFLSGPVPVRLEGLPVSAIVCVFAACAARLSPGWHERRSRERSRSILLGCDRASMTANACDWRRSADPPGRADRDADGWKRRRRLSMVFHQNRQRVVSGPWNQVFRSL